MRKVFEEIKKLGGRPILVGGVVRDELLGVESKDIDVEVFGIELSKLANVLSKFGMVKEDCGRRFPVLLLSTKDENFDFAMPRKETKVAKGRRGFETEVDKDLGFRKAARRRDFTINALMKDPETGEKWDFFGGEEDLKAGVLRHTSERFVEDPTRVLRGMQFAGRFDLTMHEDTIKLSEELLWSESHTIPKEMFWVEFEKWARKSKVPSKGLEVLRQTEWIKLFPELKGLIGLEQDKDWHPEGDAWTHTLHSVDVATKIADRNGLEGDDRLVLVFAALLHDVGKVGTTEKIDGRIRAKGHDKLGVPMAKKFLERIGAPTKKRLHERILILVETHMTRIRWNVEKPSHRQVRRIARKLDEGGETIEGLVRIAEVDASARPPVPPVRELEGLLEVAKELKLADAVPKPLVMGRHLIDLGLKPSEKFGEILSRAFEAQMDGKFISLEAGIAWVILEII
jgi:tRNA nucleotidyltransferase (CCA-adding enzyme)